MELVHRHSEYSKNIEAVLISISPMNKLNGRALSVKQFVAHFRRGERGKMNTIFSA